MSDQFSFKKVFFSACGGMLLFGIVITTLGSILPSLVDKFSLSQVSTGTLTSLLPLGILLGSLFFGPIVDRYSYKYLLIVCTLMILAGMEGIAFTENLFVLQLSLVSIGIGGGAINGGTNALVADISAATGKRSANLSFLGIFFGVGALGMPLLLGSLSQSFDYFSIIAVLGLSLALPILFFVNTKFPDAKQKHSVPLAKTVNLIKDLNLILLGLILFFQSGVEGLISNWSPLYLVNESGYVQEEALYALSTFVLSLTLTRLVLTFLLNHIRPYKVLLFSMTTGIVGILCIMTTSFAGSEILGFVLLGSGLAAGFPIVLGYVGTLYPDLSGTAFSIVLVIGLSGNILLNFYMGILSDKGGVNTFSTLLLVCAVCLMAVLLITLKRISKHTYI